MGHADTDIRIGVPDPCVSCSAMVKLFLRHMIHGEIFRESSRFQGLRPLIPQGLFCIHDDQPVHRYGLASQPVK